MPPILEDAREEILLPPPLPAPIAGQLAASPYNFTFTGEDQLALTVHNSLTGVRVAVHWRMENTKGEIIANRQEFTPATDHSASLLEFGIGTGRLLNLVAFAAAGSPRAGQTFARVRVIRGSDAAAVALGTAIQGYLTSNQDRAWPGSPIQGSLDGGGYHRIITGTDPPVDTNISETVPTGARWDLLTARARFQAAGGAGTRQGILRLVDGATVVFASPQTEGAGANEQQDWYWAQGLPHTTVVNGTYPVAGLSTPLVALAGQAIEIIASPIFTGDNFAAPTLMVREWLEVD